MRPAVKKNPGNQLWQLTVTPSIPDKGVLQTYRTQKIGDNTIQINAPENYRGLLAILITLNLLKNNKQNTSRLIPPKLDTFVTIASFAIGLSIDIVYFYNPTVINYALCLKDRPITRGLFPITFHPTILVEAVLHGDEIMVGNILKTKPDLTQVATAIDFSGRTFTGTAIQAAIATANFAPNKVNTGLCELLIESLQKQYPENWYAIFKTQTLELYKKSLLVYLKKTENTICAFIEKKENGKAIDEAAFTTAEENKKIYLEALGSNNLQTIIDVHNRAQEYHVLQVDQILIDAIKVASNEDIEAIFGNLKIDSPLPDLLKTFRENFTALSHEEIIHNPQHLIKIFALHNQFAHHIHETDPNYRNCGVLFWCHLVGFVQRYLPADTIQTIANPRCGKTIEENKKNARSFYVNFMDVGDDIICIFPLFFNSNSGLGYQFSIVPGSARTQDIIRWPHTPWIFFKTYTDQKQQSWKNLYTCWQSEDTRPVCNSVTQ